MKNVILDKQQHRHLKVSSNVASLFEQANAIPVLADELRQLVLEYPVCLIKHPEAEQFSMQALLGLEAGENLFLKDGSWQANYQPMFMVRQPFMVGITGEQGAQPTDKNTVLTIDMESSLICKGGEQGEALFAEDGSPTPFLKQKSQLAFSLSEALQRTQAFIADLTKADLIEAVQLNVTLANGDNKAIEGIYAINEKKLNQLPAEILQDFHSKGYLQACHYLIASIGNVQKLVALKS